MNEENTLLKRETYKNRRDQREHLRVIAHEGEVVVGLIKNASEARGTGGGGRAPTHPASPIGLRKCIGGEEVAATFRDTEDFSPRALFADITQSTRAQTQFG